jgi:hypothetical protein
MNQEQYKEYLSFKNMLEDAAEEVLVECGGSFLLREVLGSTRPDMLPKEGKENNFYFKKIDGNSLEYVWHETWRYGGEEYHHIDFPIHFLWDLDARAAYNKYVLEFQETLNQKNQQAAIDSEARNRQEKLALYEKLKKEYEGDK